MDEDFLKQFPTKLHRDAEIKAKFVALFISTELQLFLQLQSLLGQEKDLVEVMQQFDQFLARNRFDCRYSETSVFGALCDEAMSVANLK
jgi:hypothetical protein